MVKHLCLLSHLPGPRPHACSKHPNCLSTLTFGEGTTTPLLVLSLPVAAPIFSVASVPSLFSLSAVTVTPVPWSEASHTHHHSYRNCSLTARQSSFYAVVFWKPIPILWNIGGPMQMLNRQPASHIRDGGTALSVRKRSLILTFMRFLQHRDFLCIQSA